MHENSGPSIAVDNHCRSAGRSRRLTIEEVVEVARYRRSIVAPNEADAEHINISADWVRSTVSSLESGVARPLYGINTGFGSQAGKSTLRSLDDVRLLQRNLLESHAAGVGDYFDEDVVRAAMLIRAQSLAQGYSGVRAVIIDRLIAMLNQGIYPAIPSEGSLGASGDLAPLAHLALVLAKPHSADSSGSGEVFVPVSETC